MTQPPLPSLPLPQAHLEHFCMMPTRARAAAAKAKNLKRPITPPPPPVQLPLTPPPTVKSSRKRKAPPEEEGPQRTLHPLGESSPALLPAVLPFELSAAISHLRNVDPRFGRFFESIPCKPFQPPLTAICPFKTLVTSILGQQISWMAARAINNRFEQMFGFSEESDGFPTPAKVARADIVALKGVGLSTRKAEYVISLAEHFISGQVSTELLQNGTDEEVARALIAIRGIGQWTVDMFAMFSLRRPDVLPVGDLGVQKGLLRWALAAHNALPAPKGKQGKAASAAKAKYKNVKVEDTKTETMARTPPPSSPQLPPTPITPAKFAVIRAEDEDVTPDSIAPDEVIEVPENELPVPTTAELLLPMSDDPNWSAEKAAPLPDGLTIELMRSRLAGKKAKGGAYLTPQEMDVLTEGWRPYRSLGVYYMWPSGEDF